MESYATLAFELLQGPDMWAMVNDLAGDIERHRRLEHDQIDAV